MSVSKIKRQSNAGQSGVGCIVFSYITQLHDRLEPGRSIRDGTTDGGGRGGKKWET